MQSRMKFLRVQKFVSGEVATVSSGLKTAKLQMMLA